MDYATWASNLKLKLESQGYLDHLTQKVTDITPSDLPRYKRIFPHICMVLKNTIQSSLKQMFRAIRTLWLIIWVRRMLFFMNLMSYYLLPLLLLKN